ncbi:unnamed protein product [Linum tenue]|uniref:Flavonoid 3'-monooxygenase n=1 Tax=Linum tenue TaxID=586396 RepID=A0AAV0KBP3_9ROSI|nr:unnamed protein product [Linum tenue]
MEMNLLAAAWLATAAVLLLTLWLRRRTTRSRSTLLPPPPGPKPWPIIGNLNLIGPLPHRSLHALSSHYGPIMQLRFGAHTVMVGSSIDLAKSILKTHDLAFAGRPEIAAGKYTTYNYSDITWSQYGPYWRQARKMCLTELFSAKRLASYEYIRKEELNWVMRNLFGSGGDPVNLKDHLSDLSLNVISRMVLGKKYTGVAAAEGEIVTPEEFKEMLDELFLLNGVLDIGDSIPWLAPLDLQGYRRRMKAVARKFDRFLERVLDEHNLKRRSGGGGMVAEEDFGAKDMVDVLLELAEDPDLEVKLDRRGVKAFTQDMIAGGTESSAVTVEWAISELLKHPEAFIRATEELDRVVGNERWVEEKDVANLPYINAIVKETMRLHPVAPLLVPRLAREDVELSGYRVAKGTRVLVNVWTIGRDPTIWDAPEEFRPERFIGKDIDVKGHDFELLPFGAGRRMCPGYPLGIKVIQVSLASLLHGFKWELPSGMKREDLNMEEIYGLSTPRKFPLVAVAHPRLPLHLYKN